VPDARVDDGADTPRALWRALDTDRYAATALTRGPWSIDGQHGGPPFALMLAAIERARPSGLRLGRATIEFHGLVRVEALRVSAERVRVSRSVEVWRAALHDDAGRLVAALDALYVRETPGLGNTAPRALVGEPVDTFAATSLRWPWAPSYVDAIETRLVRGRMGAGNGVAWLRLAVPVVDVVADRAAETPLVVHAALWDAANGVGGVLPPGVASTPNVDLVVSLARLPRGAWCRIEARSTLSDGIGLLEAELSDEQGPYGCLAATTVARPAR
jgi:hypothetical protein